MSTDSDFVLLGFIEQHDEVNSNINSSSIWRENFIGGEPVFSPNLNEDELKANFAEERLKCEECGQIPAFMAQMNCPVDSKPVDRVIYVFGCVNIDCKNRKWKIFRVVTPFKDEEMTEVTDGQGDHKNKSESMELDDGASKIDPGAPFHLPFKDKVSKYKAVYLSVEEEQYLVAEEINSKKDKSKGVVIEEKSNIEKYEKFLIPGTDEVANKFIKTVSKFNKQVIRYAWHGKALLNQDTKVRPGQCTKCGGKRTFELQLMPGFICEMNPINENESTELDFGTILFFTCKNNCNRDGQVFQEEVVVLNDPDSGIMPSF